MSSLPTFRQEAGALLKLGAPIILSQVAQVVMGLLDTVMSGHAGAFEQAVVGLGIALWVPVFIGLMSVVQAVSPIIAHHFGAGDHAAVARDAREGLWLALYVGLLPTLLVPLAPSLLVLLRIDPGLAQRTGVFLWGIALGMPAALLYRSLSFYSMSIAQTRPVMVLAWIGLVVNGALNWVLIYGHFGAPAMGGAGCGWATGIGMWVSLAALALWTARAAPYKPFYVWRDWRRPSREAQKRLLALGLPMGGAAFAEVAAFCSIGILVGRFGDVQIAAHLIALNASSLVFMFPMGFSAAITVRVGHALGAGAPLAARHAAWSGMGVVLLFALLTMGPIVLARHEVAGLYSSDAAVQALAANLLLFAAFWQLFDATQVAAIGALRGYKTTVLPMVLMLVAFWGLGIPTGIWLGWFGALGSGPLRVYGFWVGLVVGLMSVSIGLAIGLQRVANGALRPRPA
jgi:multidrug resistance protein, MATE family